MTDTSNLIEITAVSPSAEEAAQVANAFAQEFVAVREETDKATVAAARDVVKQQLDSLSPTDANSAYGLLLKDKYESLNILESMQTGGFVQVTEAFQPSAPFSPRPTRSAILALAVGLVIGLGLAFGLDHFDKRVKDTKTLEKASNLPVLATIPVAGKRWNGGARGQRSAGPVGLVSNPDLLESFRVLRSSLQFFAVDDKVKTILVTSGLPREGKTVTSVNLALSLALTGSKVVLVEADLRRPMITWYLGLENRLGLSTVLTNGGSYEYALQPVDLTTLLPMDTQSTSAAMALALDHNLLCLSSGPLPPNPAELLSTDRMKRLAQSFAASQNADYVIIDTPPVLSVVDALVLAPAVDAVVVVARMNWTTREEAHEVSSRLARTGARVIGVVATGVKTGGRSYAKRGYHGYGYR